LSLDAFGYYGVTNCGGDSAKQGPEFLDYRLHLYGEDQRMVLEPNVSRRFVNLMRPSTVDLKELDPVNTPDEQLADHRCVPVARETAQLAVRDPGPRAHAAASR
jgi:hypothetical protein